MNLFILITLQYCVLFAIHRRESVMGAHVSSHPWPLSHLPLHPIPLGWPRAPTGFECPSSCIELALVICFTHGNIHVSMLFSHIISPLPSPTESKVCSLHLCLFCCLAYRIVVTIFVNSINIALIYCIGVSLSCFNTNLFILIAG